jgi:hypothetical protein
MKNLVFYLFLSFLLKPLNLLAQDIRNDDLTDNNGKVEWLWRVNVGETPFGKSVTAVFSVKNVSTDSLILQDVQVGCHCTVAEYPKEPIPPGQTVYIKATYDARSEGQFFKTINVSTNFDLYRVVTLSMSGIVKAKHN